MKKEILKSNYYLDKEIVFYYHCDYVGYKQYGNPDFLNHLKNDSNKYDEMELINDYIEASNIVKEELPTIIKKENYINCVVCLIPRSKNDRKYTNSQLLFKKAVSMAVDNLNLRNGINVIKRVKDTKTTHNWRLENNLGISLYKGITKETCEINKNVIKDRNIILVDDVYTEKVNIAEDCIQTLLDFGAKNVILYTIGKTRK